MTEKIEPALTAEEWAVGFRDPFSRVLVEYLPSPGREFPVMQFVSPGESRLWNIQRLHAIAALALCGQPFGFTREDARAVLEVLRCSIGESDAGNLVILDGTVDTEDYERVWSVLARISALLPPE